LISSFWGKISGGVMFIVCLGAGFAPHATSLETSAVDWEEMASVDTPKVKVRVLSGLPAVHLEGSNIKVDGRWTVLNEPISYHKEGRKALWISGGTVLAELPSSTTLKVEGSDLAVGDHVVPRSLKLSAREDGRIDVLADLPLEKYVEGVLAGEMPSNWPIESLKAQAVAARSFLLAIKKSPKHKTFDVDSSQFDQVYRAVYSLPKMSREQIHRAVSESQGLVLKSDAEYPMQAYFHSDCGGIGERASTVWGKSPKNMPGPACPFNPGNTWTFKVKKKQLARMFGLRALESLSAVEFSGSGRVTKLEAKSTTGHIEKVKSSALRRQLGFNNLKSTLFQIVDAGDSIEFRGRGYGHGVGLCQWGAKYMAERGKNFVDILALYYPKARIVPVSRGFQITQRTTRTSVRR